MWRLLILVSASSIAFGSGWYAANRWNAGGEVKTITKVVKVVEKQGEVNTAVATKVQAAQDRVKYVTQTITKEIPVAVPPSADPVLGNGWVRLHDAAARGVPAPAESPAEPDAAASGVDAAQALNVVVGNYEKANSCITELTGWQEWAKAQGLTQ